MIRPEIPVEYLPDGAPEDTPWCTSVVGGKRGKKQYGNRLSGLKPFSAGRSDCDSVVADDEMGGQDVEDGLNGNGLGAGVVLAEIVDGSDRGQRSSTVGGVDAGAGVDRRRVQNRFEESGGSDSSAGKCLGVQPEPAPPPRSGRNCYEDSGDSESSADHFLGVQPEPNMLPECEHASGIRTCLQNAHMFCGLRTSIS